MQQLCKKSGWPTWTLRTVAWSVGGPGRGAAHGCQAPSVHVSVPDPQMLEQLRQDPAAPVAQPQTVQRPNGSNGRPAQSGQAGANQRRSFDPFEPVKVAGTEITRFFQSVFRYDSASSR